MMTAGTRRLLIGIGPRAGVSDEFGAMPPADPRLLAYIDDEEALVEMVYRQERLRIYRMRLQSQIRSVSSLALDLADMHGAGIHGVAELLRPQFDLQRCAALMPSGRPGLHPRKGRSGRLAGGSPWMRASDQRVSYAVSRRGIVLDAEAGYGHLGFMIAKGELVAAGWLGECWFHTEGARAHIVLRAEVPETLIAAAVGRSIGQIISHELFAGREYPISRAVRIDDGPAVAFTFETGRKAVEMPWPELLEHGRLAAVRS